MKELTIKGYQNKVYGSWLGRIAGDHVGAPLEFQPVEAMKKKYGTISYYPEPIDLEYVNDDEMYEICLLIALEKYGINLTSKQIANQWIDLLYTDNYTAEYIALKNLRSGILPPESGLYNNIYYDAIGAQMRADICGQLTPGCPKMAKLFAEKDGCISHAGIGIKGEIFVSVLVSQAFFVDNIQMNIKNALKFIDSKSLYYKMVQEALKIYNENQNSYEQARLQLYQYWDFIRENYINPKGVTGSKSFSFLEKKRKRYLSDHHGVHVLPNIGIIILSLLFGSSDLEDPLGKSICVAAMMGLDTDCNCGNIGAIIGAQIGAQEIPLKWKEPLQDKFHTYVKGYEYWKISELSNRIAEIGLKIIKKKCYNSVKIEN